MFGIKGNKSTGKSIGTSHGIIIAFAGWSVLVQFIFVFVFYFVEF